MIDSLSHLIQTHIGDTLAVIFFLLFWLGYEPFLQALGKKSGLITKDLTVVRHAWMREAVLRDQKLLDSNLLGHAINSSTHFSSASLILIAAVAGAIFSGHAPVNAVRQLGIETSGLLLQTKLGLILICLSRGFLNFIWALRQMNYCAAAFGSLPETMNRQHAHRFAEALGDILDPAMSNFSQGVRGYYFALAAAAWLLGPIPFVVATLLALLLLSWRQSRSQSARGLHALRDAIERHDNEAGKV